MRVRLIGFILLAYFVSVATTQAAPPTPIIKIDASTLSDGPVPTAGITNAGSVSGKFIPKGVLMPFVETVAGKKAITFSGSNGLKADFTAPDTVTGGNPWSVSTWIYNPTIGTDNDDYFQWARRGSSGEASTGRVGRLAYINVNWGAAPHNSVFDQGWGRLNYPPTAGQWHNITVTFDGATGVGSGTGTELIYVDGILVSTTVGKPLNLFPGCQVLVGFEQNTFTDVNDVGNTGKFDKNGLSGSIASLQMWNSALSYDDVLSIQGNAPLLDTSASTDLIMNNSFENYTFGGNNTAMDTGKQYDPHNVYWTAFSYNGNVGGNTNNPNQLIRFLHSDLAAGNSSHFNNGICVDGYAIIGMEATQPTKTYISQPVWGIKPNTDYKIWGYFNARKTQDNYAQLEIKMDGVDVLSPSPMRIDALEAAGTHTIPFTRIETTWKSNSLPSHYIAIGQVGAAKYNSVLCDKICMAQVGGPAKPVFSVKDLPALTSLDFFGVQSGQAGVKSFTLVNDGGSDMKIKGLATIGNDAYNYTASYTSDVVPAYGGSVTITVTFSPTAAGVYNDAKLKIDTDAPVGSVYLPLTGFSKPMVGNGSFEQIYMNTGGGDWQGSYPAWTTNAGQGGIGFSYTNNWKWDNGKFSDGRQAATLNKDSKDNAETKMSQTIPGFIKGRTYRFRFFANVWKGTTSNAYDSQAWSDFRVNGASAQDVTRTPAGGTAQTGVDFPTTITCVGTVTGDFSKTYTQFDYDWTAPDNGAYPIEFACIGNAGGDAHNSLLLDNVTVWDQGAAGPATVSTTVLDFGTRVINTSSTLDIKVTNAGGMDLKVTTATFSGPQASQFERSAPSTMPLTVGKFNGTGTFTVRFKNTSYGQKNATLTLKCDSGEVFTIALTANTTYAAYYPQILNPSFENNALGKPSADNNDNTPDKWNWAYPNTGRQGRSHAGGQFINNGRNPEGSGAVIWIRKGNGDTTRTLWQDVAGFTSGRTYQVSIYANPMATNGTALPVNGKAHLVVSVSKSDGNNLVNAIDEADIAAVDPFGTFVTPWKKYTGTFVAPATGTLRVLVRGGMTDNADNGLLLDGISIQEVAPAIQASPASVRFSTVNWYKNDQPSVATVTITNTGLSNLVLSGGASGTTGFAVIDSNNFFTSAKAPDPQFSLVSVTPAKTTLAAGESVAVVVKFNPTKKGDYTAAGVLRVTSNDPNLPTLDIPLAGDAVPVELSTFSVE